MSSYYVIAFTHDHPLAQNHRFHSEGVRLVKDSIQRIPRTISKDQAQSVEYAIVYTLVMLPPHLRHLIESTEIQMQSSADKHQQETVGIMLNPPVEYQQYAEVHFLNEVALRMYSEGGIDFEILETISEEALPAGCNRSLRGPYIPK